jgi:hypothetical protein
MTRPEEVEEIKKGDDNWYRVVHAIVECFEDMIEVGDEVSYDRLSLSKVYSIANNDSFLPVISLDIIALIVNDRPVEIIN